MPPLHYTSDDQHILSSLAIKQQVSINHQIDDKQYFQDIGKTRRESVFDVVAVDESATMGFLVIQVSDLPMD